MTHTDLQLSRRACAWPWSREGPDASGAQSSRPGLMVGGEASFSPGGHRTGWVPPRSPTPTPPCVRFQTWSLCVHRSPEPGEARPAEVEAIGGSISYQSLAAPATQASNPILNQVPAPPRASQLSLQVSEFPDHRTSGTQLRPPWLRIPRITSVLRVSSGSPPEAPS